MHLDELWQRHTRHLKLRKRSPHTLTYYDATARTLRAYLEAQEHCLRAEAITVGDLRGFMEYLEARGLAEGGIDAHYRALKGVFGWAVKDELLDRNPTARLERVKKPHRLMVTLGGEEYRRMLAAARKSPFRDRETAIVITLFDTGLRLAEVASLTVDDVRFADGLIQVIDKGNKERVVPLGQMASEALDRYGVDPPVRKPASRRPGEGPRPGISWRPDRRFEGGRPPMTDRRMREGTFSEEQRTRFTTLAVSRNLSHVRWREVNPYGATNPVSVGLQLAATLLLWIATSPLEQAMNELDGDPLNPKLKRLWTEPDFQPDHPEGLRANLPRWWEAIAQGKVEMVLAGDGWYVVGLRARLGEPGGDSPVWEMTLDRERLEFIVDTLAWALPFWRTPITLPAPSEAGAARPGRKRKGRRANPAEPKD
ncbi:tyrosine-type recombinase/integrase [Deinococcus metallilatus]|nr:tyrosine-type recombinase/integrase [Deinococcus metallilatus]MBB5294729.1 integrase [Deinococcus metallilatus]GMA15946.1 hypothetical protein GCM10025871_22770 [Deinococcus metallilatus]